MKFDATGLGKHDPGLFCTGVDVGTRFRAQIVYCVGRRRNLNADLGRLLQRCFVAARPPKRLGAPGNVGSKHTRSNPYTYFDQRTPAKLSHQQAHQITGDTAVLRANRAQRDPPPTIEIDLAGKVGQTRIRKDFAPTQR